VAAIEIKQVRTKAEERAWISFPMDLYKNHPYYVPALMSEEKKYWNRNKNPAWKDGIGVRFLAYLNNKVVGRIAATINNREIELKGDRRVRWGCIDFIDNADVTKSLLQAVEDWAAGQNQPLDFLEGPMGLTNLDKTGLLVEGFDQLDNITTWYAHPYYEKHITACGYKRNTEYIEYLIQVPESIPERVILFSKRISERLKLRAVEDKSQQSLVHYAKKLFKLMNITHGDLKGFIPFEDDMIDHYAAQYARFIQPDFTSIIVDEEDKLIAFGVALPNFSKVFQKIKGRIWPTGWWHIRKALTSNDRADLLLIGVHPDYQSKGVPAMIFLEIMQGMMKYNIKEVESNPELADNHEVQRLWSKYDAKLHKRRYSYIKSLKS